MAGSNTFVQNGNMEEFDKDEKKITFTIQFILNKLQNHLNQKFPLGEVAELPGILLDYFSQWHSRALNSVGR